MKATVNLLISSDSALFNEGQKAAKAFKPSLVKASMFDKRLRSEEFTCGAKAERSFFLKEIQP
jgi:hypothetical protein